MEMEEKLESVLNFLKNNGLFEAEKALKEEMIGSKIEFEFVDDGFDFERYLFPMLPPPPPVRVPASGIIHRSENLVENCSKASSLDEFVSLGSSSSNLCSSEFTNPYGVHSTTGGNSKASSESLSAFDTARDCHGFDMQSDQYWYDEKDEGHFMTPCFNGGFDPFCCPSEDKFVTTLETEKSYGNLASSDHEPEVYSNYSDMNFIMTSTDDANKVTYKLNEYGLDDIEVKVVDEAPNKICSSFAQKLNINADHFINMGSTKNVYDVKDDECGNSHEHESEAATDNEDGVSADELIMYNTHEEEYEVFYLRIIHRKNRTGFEENKELPIVLNTLIAGRYYVTEYLGSAAFSRVVQAHDYHTGVDVCLKIIKNDKDFFDQSLDEIKLLKYVNKYDPADEHHILRLYDYFYHQEHLFIVCELLRANLYEFQEFNRDSDGEFYFTLSRLQIIARQCLEALEYLHDLGVIHCDLKPENILVKSYKRCEIKIIDLGSSCFKTDNLCLYVQSRSYRAPEVILGLPYDQKIDIWSLGCVLAELCSGEVLFPNDPLVMILARMIRILGPMDLDMLVQGQETDKYFTRDFDLYHTNEETNQLEYIILEKSSLEKHLQVSDIDFIDFIKYLLQYDPERRPTAKEALQHPWLSHSYEESKVI